MFKTIQLRIPFFSTYVKANLKDFSKYCNTPCCEEIYTYAHAREMSANIVTKCGMDENVHEFIDIFMILSIF